MFDVIFLGYFIFVYIFIGTAFEHSVYWEMCRMFDSVKGWLLVLLLLLAGVGELPSLDKLNHIPKATMCKVIISRLRKVEVSMTQLSTTQSIGHLCTCYMVYHILIMDLAPQRLSYMFMLGCACLYLNAIAKKYQPLT